MAIYESNIKTISSSEEVVFDVLSNMNNLSVLQKTESIEGKVKIIELDTDSCIIELEKFGKIELEITEKTPYSSLKYEFFQLPISMFAEIKLKNIVENQTQMQIILNADIPAMMKFMLDKQLEKGVNTLADMFESALNRYNH
ncbi:MAG: hypothetical protein BGO29_06355 [Bacteroidales bacterium 36-12]|nr:MAG: hypothetical protein BGO29_06355 [Bacteroidales bacterium 36-12]